MHDLYPHILAFIIGIASAYGYNYVRVSRGKKIVVLFNKDSNHIDCARNNKNINRVRLLIFNNGDDIINKSDVNLLINIGCNDEIKILSVTTEMTSHDRDFRIRYCYDSKNTIKISFNFLNIHDYIVTDIFFYGRIEKKEKAISLNGKSYIKGFKILINPSNRWETRWTTKLVLYLAYFSVIPISLSIIYYYFLRLNEMELSKADAFPFLFFAIFCIIYIVKQFIDKKASEEYIEVYQKIPMVLIRHYLFI